jgi:hypothetical protein
LAAVPGGLLAGRIVEFHQSIALAAYALSYKYQQLDFRALKS